MRRPILAALLATAPAGAFAQGGPLTLAMHYNQEQAAPLLACLDIYEDETGQAAEYRQISYGDYLQTVLTGRIGGTQPDIYHLYSIWGAQMAENGVLAEPPEEVADFVRETYGETAEAATIDGTLYGVPTEVSVYMLVSNMALLREAGYDSPPATWEELREVADAITTRNDQGRIETAGFAFADSAAGSVHPFYALLASRGGEVYSDGFSEANLDSPEAAAAVRDMAGLVEDGITDKSVDGFDFPAGGIGMIVMANWMKSSIQEGLGSLDDVAVTPIPAGEGWRTLSYAFFMGVDSQSERQDDAWALVRWLNSDASADESGVSCMGRVLSGIGALTANASDNAAMGEADAFTQPFLDALAEGRATGQPNVMQAAEIEGMMAEAIDTVLAGDAEAEAALEDLDGRVEDILFEFY
ncbi:carbohydrate ABC transporter substrate-binding protein (CUT1 family) [Hasllibacter halocynthiae]|uniref:sn-glycerol-3-phosphate-binding periplasmic protein UgpB n=1 Tax=Hasllibacter halocynthiae TaxID=595589 RepID=A0A2T0X2D8_9RHOB|nr:extracellular solute-binding protein [Hasllibacter halocynthiae]PRY93108.1 carbohydrate ABC transporter substrate-binding protein (CUT1 family) [Hasllibacter halocynthiae]